MSYCAFFLKFIELFERVWYYNNTLGWSKDPGPHSDGQDARHFFCEVFMKELSIFVDESGDWGEYQHHAPYYIITFVFHDQDVNIVDDLSRLDADLRGIGYSGHCLHTGPIIRGEEEYRNVEIDVRQRILRKMMGFVRRMDIHYKSFYIEKKQFDNSIDAIGRISKQISAFVKEHFEYFFSYNRVKVYYDNGQTEVNKILSSVLNALIDGVEFKRVLPKDYRLFQVADFLCMMTLLNLKIEHKTLSKTELTFFENERTLKKKYIKPVMDKEMK